MPRKIKVISGDKDGADLRREQFNNRLSIRCSGSHDDNQINEAILESGKGKLFTTLPGESWERIFNKGRTV